MKTLLILPLSLICLLHHNSASLVAPELMLNGGCCPQFNQTRIPKGRVNYVGMTPDNCRIKAIVVLTVCNKTFCIDPEWGWAKNLLSKFEKSSGQKSSPATC